MHAQIWRISIVTQKCSHGKFIQRNPITHVNETVANINSNELDLEKVSFNGWNYKPNDWRDQIDEPIRQKRRHSQEKDVAQQIVAMLVHLVGPLLGSFGEIMFNQPPSDQLWQQVA